MAKQQSQQIEGHESAAFVRRIQQGKYDMESPGATQQLGQPLPEQVQHLSGPASQSLWTVSMQAALQ